MSSDRKLRFSTMRINDIYMARRHLEMMLRFHLHNTYPAVACLLSISTAYPTSALTIWAKAPTS